MCFPKAVPARPPCWISSLVAVFLSGDESRDLDGRGYQRTLGNRAAPAKMGKAGGKLI